MSLATDERWWEVSMCMQRLAFLLTPVYGSWGVKLRPTGLHSYFYLSMGSVGGGDKVRVYRLAQQAPLPDQPSRQPLQSYLVI